MMKNIKLTANEVNRLEQMIENHIEMLEMGADRDDVLQDFNILCEKYRNTLMHSSVTRSN